MTVRYCEKCDFDPLPKPRDMDDIIHCSCYCPKCSEAYEWSASDLAWLLEHLKQFPLYGLEGLL